MTTKSDSTPADPVGQVQNETPRRIPNAGSVSTPMAAWLYAQSAHGGQTDKSGQLYIQHLSRVAKSVEHLGSDFEIVAWLHDVMEDREDLVGDLTMRVSPNVHDALVWLARAEGTNYDDYVRNTCHYGNELAIAVKLADLFDHLRYGAWNVLTPGQTQRYIDAIAIIHRSQQSSDKAVTHEG